MHIAHSTLVEVNESICEHLARVLMSKRIPEDREDVEFQGLAGHELGNLLLFVVAICHQTSARGVRPLAGSVGGKTLRGWDYLLQRFIEAAGSEKSLLLPGFWKTMSGQDLRLIFRNTDGEDLLTDVEIRANLINDLGCVMQAQGWPDAQAIYDQCGGRLNSGVPNLVDCLARFRAYSDPVCKKSFFLLSLMQNTGQWSYKDPEQLGAPVDYHEVRGHLRIGTVTVNDEALRLKLLHHTPVTPEEDMALRSAVLKAIMLLSDRTGLRNPSQLHYMFWNVFRNYCTREEPNCMGHRAETYLPSRYRKLAILIAGKEACPFSGVCQSVNSASRFYEHMFETDYY